MRTIKFQAIVGCLLVAVGLGLFWLRDNNAFSHAQPAAPVANSTWQAPKAAISGNPVRLQIPSLGMDLPIINGTYSKTTRTWTLTTNKVQYAVNTALPNDTTGDTFLYGHYRPEVFARLHLIKPGATVTVTTDNGHIFTYTYTGYKVIDPSDTSIFQYQGKPELTIQTCTGLFFEHRQLFHFNYDGVKNV
ncbi:MAG TPA: sortase [Candidatus Saccharimonadales bacterium]|nr:sortase [Candidatus Saccharimonadales bacterium]